MKSLSALLYSGLPRTLETQDRNELVFEWCDSVLLQHSAIQPFLEGLKTLTSLVLFSLRKVDVKLEELFPVMGLHFLNVLIDINSNIPKHACTNLGEINHCIPSDDSSDIVKERDWKV